LGRLLDVPLVIEQSAEESADTALEPPNELGERSEVALAGARKKPRLLSHREDASNDPASGRIKRRVKRITSVLMASCSETAHFLSAHVDEELSGLRRLRVARHLSACPRCRALYETLVRTVSGLRVLGRELPPERPGFADDVIARLEATP
jgi:hypothetical protein